jgi:hypothetical protein
MARNSFLLIFGCGRGLYADRISNEQHTCHHVCDGARDQHLTNIVKKITLYL